MSMDIGNIFEVVRKHSNARTYAGEDSCTPLSTSGDLTQRHQETSDAFSVTTRGSDNTMVSTESD
ncbi:hypothetical protein DPMN_077851, partial [Dreissena polymorpha]